MLFRPIDLCAYAYLEYYRSQFKNYSWAYDKAEVLVHTKPEEGLSLIVNILELCRNEEEIAYVASGLLEELLHIHVNEVSTSIVSFLDESVFVRKAMKYVWVPEGSHIQQALLKATGKLGRDLLSFDVSPSYIEDKAVDE